MHVTVVSPERAVFDGPAEAVVAPAYDGQVGILPRHAPFLTLLGSGMLTVSGGEAGRFPGAGGVPPALGGGGRRRGGPRPKLLSKRPPPFGEGGVCQPPNAPPPRRLQG